MRSRDQKSGIYVRDQRTGMVKMVRGETSYLVDPRCEEHVHRQVPHDRWNLWIGHAEPHKLTTGEVVRRGPGSARRRAGSARIVRRRGLAQSIARL